LLTRERWRMVAPPTLSTRRYNFEIQIPIRTMLKNPFSRRLLKKVQMQGGARRAE
jgi:hypothetical protein